MFGILNDKGELWDAAIYNEQRLRSSKMEFAAREALENVMSRAAKLSVDLR